MAADDEHLGAFFFKPDFWIHNFKVLKTEVAKDNNLKGLEEKARLIY